MLSVDLVDREEVNAEGTFVSTHLDPSDEQRIQAAALLEGYARWCRIISACVRRAKRERALNAFEQVAASYVSYFHMMRVGANISHSKWRALFVQETESIVDSLSSFVEDQGSTLSILEPRPQEQVADFDVAIVEIGGVFRVEARSPIGSAHEKLEWTITDEMVNAVLDDCARRSGRRRRGALPPDLAPLSAFGRQLFETVFCGSVRDLYKAFRAHQGALGGITRVRFRMEEASTLWRVPWELIADGDEFLSLSPKTSVVRHFDRNVVTGVPSPTAPLRVLITASSPGNLPALDTDKEIEEILTSLGPLLAAGLIEVDVAEDGTVRTLQRMLAQARESQRQYNVWHFIGHGDYDEKVGTGSLAFERGSRSVEVSGFEIATILGGQLELEMVVLNACESASSDSADALSAVGSSIAQLTTATVVAMQFPISDAAAIVLSEELYYGIAGGQPIDLAAVEARRAIFAMPNLVEWVTPVVYMRGQGAQLLRQ